MIKNLIDSFKNRAFIALISFDKPEKNIIIEPKDVDKKGIKFKLNSRNNQKINYTLEKFPISFDEYKKSFKKVRKYQENGENEILNLCFSTKIRSNLSLDEIYNYANAKALIYKENEFICFTPEPFITIKDGFIHAFPMKGTIDSKIKDAKNILLNDKKEIDEQKNIVNFMKNELLKVCENVEIKRFRYIEKVNELYQTSSHLKGKIKKNLSLGDIFSTLLPATSITGNPKDKALKIIKECEIEKRGFYSGVFIHYDGKICKSFVMIRFIKSIKNELFYFSGGGITINSDVKKEYDELIKKVYLPF